MFVWEGFTFLCMTRQIVTVRGSNELNNSMPQKSRVQPMCLLHGMWGNLHQNSWQRLSNYWKLPFTEMLLEAERDEVQSGSAQQTKMQYSWSHICNSCQIIHGIIQSPLLWLSAWQMVMTAGFLPDSVWGPFSVLEH